MRLRTAHAIGAILIATSKEFTCSSLEGKPLVCFQGTQSVRDLLLDDLNIRPISWPRKRDARVHGGFAQRTRRLSNTDELGVFIEENDDFILTGHSLGGCCAILLASKLERMGKRIHSVYTFGAPNLATPSFVKQYNREQDLCMRTHNIVLPRDPIVFKIPNVYRRVGLNCEIPFESDSLWAHHDMASYLFALEDAYSRGKCNITGTKT